MPGRKIFRDSVTPLPDQEGITPQGFALKFTKPGDEEQVLRVLFSLSMGKKLQADLEYKVAHGETVTPAELQKTYVPPAEEVKSLVDWLSNEGFEDIQVSPNGTGVYASGKVSLIEKTLQVRMVRVTREGITYTAAQDAPSLPDEVGQCVHAIIGLQPFRHANKHRTMPVCVGNKRKTRDPLKEKTQLTPAIAGTPPYNIADILKAYNAEALELSGKGQTIAILIDSAPVDTDLNLFWEQNKLPVTMDQIQVINVNSQTLPPPEGEETLDTEWTSGIAPGANIRIYASGSLDFVSLDNALDKILTDLVLFPGMRQLSISLGLGETYMGGPQGEVATQHQKYLRLAAAGVNVFISTGDAGSNPDNSGHQSNGPLQTEYPSSDSCVVAVGGTTLVLADDSSVTSETGWSSSGGGQSIFFDRPEWQKGSGVKPGTKRLIPDVSLAADPNEGALVVLGGKSHQIGGTSWSAPVWAGFCALLNEAREKNGKDFLPFLNPLLYPLIGTDSFRDITVGDNGQYNAGAGHDLVTGIGVPNVRELIKVL